MAFMAGSIIGHVDLKTGDFTMNADKVMGKTGGMAKSMFSAQVAFAAFKKVLRFVTDAVKDSVAEFAAHEQIAAQTAAVLKSTSYVAGLTAQNISDLASKFAGLTTFEDDTIQSAQNLLLTFTKIGKDAFEPATEIILDMSTALGQDLKSGAIQVGKALQDPILGVTALRRVGVNFNKTQMDMIKNLVNTGRSAEAQAMIMKELKTEFGGSAKAARDTFGGALKVLDNQMGEVKESVGAYIAAAGRPLVENLIEQGKQIESWLKSAQGMEVISDIVGGVAAGFELIKQIVTPIVNAIWPALVSIGDQVKASFTQIFGEGEKATDVFTLLAGVSKGVALALTIVGKVIEFTIQTIGNLINAVKLSVETFGAFFTAMSRPYDMKAWDALKEKAVQTGAAFVKIVTDQKDGIVNIVKTGVVGVIDLVNTTEAEGKKMAAAVTSTFRDTKGNIIRTLTATKDAVKATYREMMEAPQELTATEKEWAEARKTISEDELQTKLRHIKEKAAEYYAVATDSNLVDQWVAKESEKAAGDVGNAWTAAWSKASVEANKFADVVSSTWSSISVIWQQALQNETTALDNDYKRRKAYIEANVADESARATQLDALDKEYEAAKAEAAKKSFYAEQAMAVSNIVFSTGQAVMQAFAQWGWPWGLIPAGLAIALGAVQTGLVLSEQPPAMALGGQSEKDQFALVGERGKELAFLPRNTKVFSADKTERMLEGAGGSANVNFWGDINNDVDIDRTAAIMAAKLEAAMRGAA